MSSAVPDTGRESQSGFVEPYPLSERDTMNHYNESFFMNHHFIKNESYRI